jgi:hypothetical protein
MSKQERMEEIAKLYEELNKARSNIVVDIDYVCDLVSEIARLESAA